MSDQYSEPGKSAALVSNCADILGVLDGPTLAIEEINPAFTTLLGYHPRDTKMKSIVSFLADADAERLRMLMSTGEEQLSFEMPVRAANGANRSFAWKVLVKDGKWFISLRDTQEVTDLRNALASNIAALEGAHKELDSFIYSVSHDLRAPLRAIFGNAQVLEEDFSDMLTDEARVVLKKIRNNTLRMDALFNDVLAYSRIGRKEVRKSALDMDELVKGVFGQLERNAGDRAKINIGNLPEGYGDRSMLEIVWTNLISNALKFSSKKDQPEIEVGGSVRHGVPEYYIKDNGAGFDMAYAGKLFGTFQRLHDIAEFEGVGMGLAIAHRIVTKHGGAMRAEASPGEGARFSFTLPR